MGTNTTAEEGQLTIIQRELVYRGLKAKTAKILQLAGQGSREERNGREDCEVRPHREILGGMSLEGTS